MALVYIDVDTQLDFVSPAGALSVPGAAGILGAVGELNRYAIAQGIPLLATVDAHTETDPEFQFWPHHCVAGTLGQRKAEQTLVPGLRLLEKQNVNCFTQPMMEEWLREVGATEALVYGVVTEICVKHSVLGLLDRGIAVEVAATATKELDGGARDLFYEEVRARGGKIRLG